MDVAIMSGVFVAFLGAQSFWISRMFDQVNKRLDRIEHRIDRVEDRMDRFDERLVRVEDMFLKDYGERITRLEERLRA